jgi:hypothetical protein
MTAAEKHAKQRLAEAVKSVSHQWGKGWPCLSSTQREAFVRAEMLADIHRAQNLGDAVTFRSLVEAMAAAAMQWDGWLGTSA